MYEETHTSPFYRELTDRPPVLHHVSMNMTALPARAYDLLDAHERLAVDDYVKFAILEQGRKREAIIHALYLPIPSEFIRRSKDALLKPLCRAALIERITEAADLQDISPSRVIRENAVIAHSNIADYVEQGMYGDFKIKDIRDINPAKMGAVKSIECKPTLHGLHMKIVLHDKHPSLKMLGELVGLIAPDKPPALEEYATPVQQKALEGQVVPAKRYEQLLELG